jgi:hypothetical protein
MYSLADAVFPVLFILFLFFYTRLVDTTPRKIPTTLEEKSTGPSSPAAKKKRTSKPDDAEISDLLNELDLPADKRESTERAWKGMTAEQWASPTPRIVQENLRLYKAKLDQTRNRLAFEAKKKSAGTPEALLPTAGTPESQQLIAQLEGEEKELSEVTEMLEELQEQMMMEHVMDLLNKQGTGNGVDGVMDKSVADAVKRGVEDASMEGSCDRSGGGSGSVHRRLRAPKA